MRLKFCHLSAHPNRKIAKVRFEIKRALETEGHLRPTKGHLRSPKGHLRPTKGHLRPTKGHLRPTKGHLRPEISICNIHFYPLEHHFSGLWWPYFCGHELKRPLKWKEIAMSMFIPLDYHFSGLCCPMYWQCMRNFNQQIMLFFSFLVRK